MKRWKKIVLGSLAAVVVTVLVVLVPTIWGMPWVIEHFYARVFVEYMLEHPQLLSSLRIFEPLGLDFHNDELDDYSVGATRRHFAMAIENLEILHGYDRGTVDDPLSYEVLEWFLADICEGERWAFHDYPVNQQSGVQSGLPDFMINTHRIDDRRGAQNYLARLAAFGPAFDQIIASLEYRESLGVVPPRFVMTHVLEQMREFVASAPEENPLHEHFAARLMEIDELSDGERAELLARATRTISDVVYPSYRRLIAHYAALEPTASTEDGVWKLPDGEAYYAHLLRSFTTTTLGADEIHAIGLAEVARIRAEMRSILEAEGLPGEDLGATMARLNADPSFLYPDNDSGRQMLLDDYAAIIAEMHEALPLMFQHLPRAAVVVKPVPGFRDDTAPGAYYDPPPMDGSRPGTFYVNLADLKENPRFGMRTLAYHEAIPGHHFQIALAREMEGVPFFRRLVPFTAYTEGWALYAEQLAAEQGFENDPYDRLGYLVAQAMRAVRLVVDTGLHHERWTRAEAIDYMLANTGMPEGEVVSEVERYIVSPGQATAYMVGYLEIMRLRREAQERLGDDFDLRDFHQVVLENGALPLTLLRRQVEAWYGDHASSAQSS